MNEKDSLQNALILLLSAILLFVTFGCCCFGVMPILFCDTGPVSSCEQSSLIILVGAGLALVLALVVGVIGVLRMRK